MSRSTRGIQLPALLHLRTSRALSRKSVADAVGLNYATLWRLETGKTGASGETAILLSEHFGVPLEELRKNMHSCP